MAVWQIRAGRNSQMANAFLTEKRVCLGYGVSVSLTQFRDQSELREWLQANAPGEGRDAPNEGRDAPKLLWQLISGVQIGDLVVMPTKPSRREYAIGRITGGYELAQDLVAANRDPHTRAVEWLKTSILGDRFVNLGLPRPAIARLSGDDVEGKINEILDSDVD